MTLSNDTRSSAKHVNFKLKKQSEELLVHFRLLQPTPTLYKVRKNRTKPVLPSRAIR